MTLRYVLWRDAQAYQDAGWTFFALSLPHSIYSIGAAWERDGEPVLSKPRWSRRMSITVGLSRPAAMAFVKRDGWLRKNRPISVTAERIAAAIRSRPAPSEAP